MRICTLLARRSILIGWLLIGPYLSVAHGIECQDFTSELAAVELPELDKTSCPTSANTRYGNRLLSQNFRVVGSDLAALAAAYEQQLQTRGWIIQQAPFDRRTAGRFGVISATHPASGKVTDIVIRATNLNQVSAHMLVHVVVSDPRLTPEQQLANANAGRKASPAAATETKSETESPPKLPPRQMR